MASFPLPCTGELLSWGGGQLGVTGRHEENAARTPLPCTVHVSTRVQGDCLAAPPFIRYASLYHIRYSAHTQCSAEGLAPGLLCSGVHVDSALNIMCFSLHLTACLEESIGTR